jgi:hypothetical protein
LPLIVRDGFFSRNRFTGKALWREEKGPETSVLRNERGHVWETVEKVAFAIILSPP